MINLKTILKKERSQKASVVAIILLLTIIGVDFLVTSHAQSPYAAVSAASGILSGQATIKAASNGSYVQFGSYSSPPPVLAIHVSGGQLVNAQRVATRLLGVDAGGTEDSCIDAASYNTWPPLDASEAAAMAAWKVNAVRIPLNEDCWLGINGATTALAGANYQNAIKNWVNTLNRQGFIVILDLHWTAPGTYPANQQYAMADSDHSITFWSQVAGTFKANPAVIFDPFNEPAISVSPNPSWTPTSTDWACWLNGCSITESKNTLLNGTYTSVTYTTAGMQQLVSTIRATGATQPIMVGGLNNAGDPCGTKDLGGNGGACMETSYMPRDPLNQLAISFHTYNWTSCTTLACWNTTLAGARAANLPIITGEFGERDCLTSYNDAYMNWADANKVSYLMWSWRVDNSAQQTCTSPNPDFRMLSNWGGATTPHNPASADFKSHLLTAIP
ncbi:MAG TPA: cellulase family glycosylhydrolase [Candidatus Saccharimonadales bacterium]